MREKTKFIREFGAVAWLPITIWGIVAFALLYIAREVIPEEVRIVGVDVGQWESFLSVFGVIYAIIIGMLIVEALRRFHELTSLTELELNAIEDIRDLLVYLDDKDKARPAIWESLRNYIISVIEEEWVKMKENPQEMDSDTSEKLIDIMKAVRLIRAKEDISASKIALESIINKITEITTYRTERIKKSGEHIAYPMRALILGMSILIVSGVILMVVESFWMHLLIVLSSTTAITTLYLMISDLNQPFGGIWDLSNSSFRKLAGRLGFVDVTCEEFKKQKNIEKQIEIHPEFPSKIPLKVKLFNPSTKVQWTVLKIKAKTKPISGQTIFSDIKHDWQEPKSEPPPHGTPGYETWTFRALRNGEATISMEWVHHDKKGGIKAKRTFALEVIVNIKR